LIFYEEGRAIEPPNGITDHCYIHLRADPNLGISHPIAVSEFIHAAARLFKHQLGSAAPGFLVTILGENGLCDGSDLPRRIELNFNGRDVTGFVFSGTAGNQKQTNHTKYDESATGKSRDERRQTISLIRANLCWCTTLINTPLQRGDTCCREP